MAEEEVECQERCPRDEGDKPSSGQVDLVPLAV